MRYPYLSIGLVMSLSFVLPLAGQFPAPGQDRDQARSMVVTRRGIVATDQVLASQAAAEILARAGSAADAAIAANSTMGVMEPMMNGIGGDLFAIVWDAKTGKPTGLNSSGWAPEKLTPALLAQKGMTAMPRRGIYTVTVPGAVVGWAALHERFGKLPWRELFQPAIYYAKNGFPVAEFAASYWKTDGGILKQDANGERVFLTGETGPKWGEIFRNPEYAAALELIAAEGPGAFYRGALARAILATSTRLGGVLIAADLADFKPEWVQPISTTYRGWTVYELPPNGQGMAALEMLNIFERFPLSQYGFASAEAFHVKMEAQRLAYTDLFRYNGDPGFSKIPFTGMISKEYAAERAATIDPARARCDPPAGDPTRYGDDTTYLTAIDANGNIVSLIQSLFSGFGSGVVVDGYGFALQNRGAWFVLDAASPDVLAPRKRPFHTIIPAFMEKGSVHLGFGIMGGLNQSQAHAQFVSNIADHGMNPQQALEAPRFTKLDTGGCDFLIENRVPAEVREKLEAMGYVLNVRGAFSSEMGGGHVVVRDTATGMNYAASSPRKDGAAIPEPDPIFPPK